MLNSIIVFLQHSKCKKKLLKNILRWIMNYIFSQKNSNVYVLFFLIYFQYSLKIIREEYNNFNILYIY